MDQSTFDSLTRALGTGANCTRRWALTAVGGLFVARLAATADAAGKNRRKRRRRRKRKAQFTCFGTLTCAYVAESSDYDDCNFAGSSVFAGGVGYGSGFRRANFNGANLEGADLSGSKFLRADLRNANLRNINVSGSTMDEACLFDTDLTGAIFSGPFLAAAYLCRTILPDGTVSDRDCQTAAGCCYT